MNPVHPASLSFSDPLQFKDLDSRQRELLAAAWNWLEEHQCPRDVLTQSRYIFTTLEGSPVAVAEVRDYPDEVNNQTWIQILFVRNSERGRQIGSRLLHHVRNLYRRHGSKIGFGTQADNVRMQQIGERIGFERAYEYSYTYPEGPIR